VVAKVIPIPMNDQRLRRRIAELAADSSRVIVSVHAKKRMRERRISLSQVLEVLLKGKVCEPAHQDLSTGDWRCTLECRVAGDCLRIGCAVRETADGTFAIVVTVIRQ